MHAAETEYMISDAPVTLDLGKDCNISQYKFFLGSYELEDNRNLTITLRTHQTIQPLQKHLQKVRYSIGKKKQRALPQDMLHFQQTAQSFQ